MKYRPKSCMKCGGKMQTGGVPKSSQVNNQLISEIDTFDPQLALYKRLINNNSGDSDINPDLIDNEPESNIYDDLFNLNLGIGTATTGLSELSGILERSRQNRYLQEQMAQMGQINPIPVDNFQPNPYSLYAKYGGSLSKYRKMQTGGTNPPIIVNDPNDPRLKAYNDSLRLYKRNFATEKDLINELPDYKRESDLTKWPGNIKPIIGYTLDRDKIKNKENFRVLPEYDKNGIMIGFKSAQVYKNPVQPYIYEELPKAATVSQPLLSSERQTDFRPPLPGENYQMPNLNPVYGPSNQLIGTIDNSGNKFFPDIDNTARRTADSDINILNNPKALQNYLDSKVGRGANFTNIEDPYRLVKPKMQVGGTAMRYFRPNFGSTNVDMNYNVDENAIFSSPINNSGTDRVFLADLISTSVSQGVDPLSTDYGKSLVKNPLSDQNRDLIDYISLYNQRKDISKLSPEDRVSNFYDMASLNPKLSPFIGDMKTIGMTPKTFSRTTPQQNTASTSLTLRKKGGKYRGK